MGSRTFLMRGTMGSGCAREAGTVTASRRLPSPSPSTKPLAPPSLSRPQTANCMSADRDSARMRSGCHEGPWSLRGPPRTYIRIAHASRVICGRVTTDQPAAASRDQPSSPQSAPAAPSPQLQCVCLGMTCTPAARPALAWRREDGGRVTGRWCAVSVGSRVADGLRNSKVNTARLIQFLCTYNVIYPERLHGRTWI